LTKIQQNHQFCQADFALTNLTKIHHAPCTQNFTLAIQTAGIIHSKFFSSHLCGWHHVFEFLSSSSNGWHLPCKIFSKPSQRLLEIATNWSPM